MAAPQPHAAVLFISYCFALFVLLALTACPCGVRGDWAAVLSSFLSPPPPPPHLHAAVSARPPADQRSRERIVDFARFVSPHFMA